MIVLQNIATGKFKTGYRGPMWAYCRNFTDYDPLIYQEVEVEQLPDIELWESPPVDQIVQLEQSRISMSEAYLSAPLELRILFAPILAQVNTALDMSDFVLAKALVEGANVDAIEDEGQRTLAQEIKSQLLVLLNGLQ